VLDGARALSAVLHGLCAGGSRCGRRRWPDVVAHLELRLGRLRAGSGHVDVRRRGWGVARWGLSSQVVGRLPS
jgi:hypothetical protein